MNHNKLRASLVALVVLFAAILFPGVAKAQSGPGFSYIFPGATAATDIAIANINNQSVSVTAAFYRNSGDVVSTTIAIGAGRQARVNATSSGISDFGGSVVITSGLALGASASVLSED